jgi:hypothetical protein
MQRMLVEINSILLPLQGSGWQQAVTKQCSTTTNTLRISHKSKGFNSTTAVALKCQIKFTVQTNFHLLFLFLVLLAPIWTAPKDGRAWNKNHLSLMVFQWPGKYSEEPCQPSGYSKRHNNKRTLGKYTTSQYACSQTSLLFTYNFCIGMYKFSKDLWDISKL